jgi:hypothetical protein
LAEARESAEVRSQAEAEDVKRLPLKFHQGEIVAVNEYGSVYRLNERTTGAEHDQIEERTRALERSGKLPSLHEATVNATKQRDKQAAEKQAEREQRKAASQQAAKARQQDKLQREHPLKAFVRDDRATDAPPVIEQKKPEIQKPPIAQQQTAPPIAATVKETTKAIIEPVKAVQKAAPKITGRVANSAAKIVEEVCSILEFFAPSPPPREITPQELFRSDEAREERKVQLAIEERQKQALENVRYDYESGRGIAREDLHNLGRYQLEAIMAYGIDDGLKLLIQDHGRHRER